VNVLCCQLAFEFVNFPLIGEYRDTFLELREDEICAKVLSGLHWPVEVERDRFGYDRIRILLAFGG
jgi:hypothetical protein